MHLSINWKPPEITKSSDDIERANITQAYDGPDPVVSLVVASPIPEVEDTPDDSDDEGFAIQSTNTQTVGVKHDNFGSDDEQQRKDFLAQAIMMSRSSNEDSSVKETNEALTSSMQSLVDGLMNWGGIDVEDNFALPTGMAASIALEESAAFGTAQ